MLVRFLKTFQEIKNRDDGIVFVGRHNDGKLNGIKVGFGAA
jgi:hypothetical protein